MTFAWQIPVQHNFHIRCHGKGNAQTLCSARTADINHTTIIVKAPPSPKAKGESGIQLSTIIAKTSTLCKEGRVKEAMGYLGLIDEHGAPASTEIYARLLDGCGDVKALAEGRQVHAHMLINGVQQKAFIAAKLISMYCRCERLEEARNVFDKISDRNILVWNAMIRGYVKNRFAKKGLELYRQMQRQRVQPDKFTFPCILNACAATLSVTEGKKIHIDIINSGFESDLFVGNALIDVCQMCKC